jgi:hypothetical protein
VQRRERGVLPARSLPVVVTPDDNTRCHLLGFSGNSGSKRRNVYLASSGTFERNAITSTPSGVRSPVEMSSGNTMVTVPLNSSGSSSASGGS